MPFQISCDHPLDQVPYLNGLTTNSKNQPDHIIFVGKFDNRGIVSTHFQVQTHPINKVWKIQAILGLSGAARIIAAIFNKSTKVDRLANIGRGLVQLMPLIGSIALAIFDKIKITLTKKKIEKEMTVSCLGVYMNKTKVFSDAPSDNFGLLVKDKSLKKIAAYPGIVRSFRVFTNMLVNDKFKYDKKSELKESFNTSLEVIEKASDIENAYNALIGLPLFRNDLPSSERTMERFCYVSQKLEEVGYRDREENTFLSKAISKML